MGQPKGEEQGTKTPVDLRIGIDIDGFKGVHTNRDPGAIARNALQRARNVRLDEGMPVPRGGQEKILATPIGSAWDGLCDVGGGANDGTQRLYVSGILPLAPFVADAWYVQNLPVGDQSNGSFYVVAIGVAGSVKVIRIFRNTKPVAGEVNLLYSGSASGADPFLLRAIGLTSATEVAVSGTFSPGTGSATVPPGTAFAELDVSAISTMPSLTTSQLVTHWAEAGIVYFSFADGANAKLYKADTNTGTVTLVGTYTLYSGVNPISNYFFKLGSQILALVQTGASSYNLLQVPSGTTSAVPADWQPTSGSIMHAFHPAVSAVLSGKAYVVGQKISNGRASLLEIDSVFAMALFVDTNAGAGETVATFSALLHYHNVSFDTEITFNGTVFGGGSSWGGPTTINSYPIRGYFHSDGRLYVLNPGGGGTVNLLRRSAVNSYTTAFSNFGTLTASGAGLPRSVGNSSWPSYLSVIP